MMMGGGWSVEDQEKFAAELFQSVQSSSVMPDIGIDYSILKYSGLDSSSALEDFMFSQGPGYVKDLGSSLSNFDNIPNAVGLGALLISILLEVAINMRKNSEADVPGMMRRVFAEEKASGVRDSIDEYIKHFRLKMLNREELLYETKCMEEQLSNGLTRLRNSMLHDDQISTRSMKHWTNGAAFHLQMFIHKARMEVERSGRLSSELQRHVVSVGELADHYGNDLKNLLTKYEAYKRSTTYTDTKDVVCGGTQEDEDTCHYFSCAHFDREFNTQAGFKNGVDWSVCHSLEKTYQNYMFKNWNQPKELMEYFPTIKQNLNVTIMQNTTFSIKKFLPASRKKR